MARAVGIEVGEAVGDDPRLAQAPRTEELPFARSPSSGGDLRNGHNREGKEADCEDIAQCHAS
jgi:hypothetical protein